VGQVLGFLVQVIGPGAQPQGSIVWCWFLSGTRL